MAPDEAVPAESLAGARVQRVDTPRAEEVVLGLRWRTDEGWAKGHLVLRPTGATLADERPRGAPVDGFGRRLRKLLTGARLVAVERRGAQLRVRLVRGAGPGKPAPPEMRLGHEGGQPVLRDEAGKPLAGRSRLATKAPESGWEPAAVARGTAPPVQAGGSPWAKAGRRRCKALRRTIAAVEREAARAERAPTLRQEASLLKAHAHTWVAGEPTLEVRDFYAEPPALRAIAVDPQRGPSETADQLFHRARRFERGAELGHQRLVSLREELSAIERWLESEPGSGSSPDELAAWEAEGRELGVSRRQAQHAKHGRSAPRRPYRRFLGAGDRAILVGRGAADNDQLTLRHARPWDLWLHAKSRRGAHVVVPLEKSEACPPELLADAGMLAAHFSEAHGDAIVEVSYVPRRHVHKRRGDPPGAVRPSRERVLPIRMDPERIRALLARERE